MNRGRHLARRARHAAVGDEPYAKAPVLQHAERRREPVQLRHAVRARALIRHHDDHVAIELTGAKRGDHVFLRREHSRRRFDDAPLGRHGRDFDDGAAEIAVEHPDAARRIERLLDAAQHVAVVADLSPVAPREPAAVQERLLHVARKTATDDGRHVEMQQTGVTKLADQKRNTAGRLEVVHVGRAVRVDAGEQGHHRGELGEIVPVDEHARCFRHRDQMNRVIRRAAGGEQADDAVDHRFDAHYVRKRRGLAALRRKHDGPRAGRHRQSVAQPRAGIHE